MEGFGGLEGSGRIIGVEGRESGYLLGSLGRKRSHYLR